MKRYKNISPVVTLIALAICGVVPVSCHKNLLDQSSTTQPLQNTFWKTEQDATEALQGLYASIRPCFDRDYYMDGHGEYFRCRGVSATSGNLRLGDAYQSSSTSTMYAPTGYGQYFDRMYQDLYGAVDNANYVIANAQRMQATNSNLTNSPTLATIVAEARLLRGLAYFKLISMWGDVPYYTFAPTTNDQVQTLSRMPIRQVKDSILADYTYAFSKLPDPGKTALGRASKVAALALRGKLYLYWGSWNKYGWPELEGFTPSAGEAAAAFAAAAADLHSVSYDYPAVTLYLNGDPGQTDSLGHADVLPNYFNLFMPKANGNPEMLMVFTHGGTGTGQGEELMRDFAGRSHEGSQCWVTPRYEIADRYQLISTGDFAPKLKPMNPTTSPNARTALNSALNPQSYAGRDYRMKATIQWDYEVSQGSISQVSTGWVPFIYRSWAAKVTIGGVDYLTYNTDGCNSGYVFRKFVRNYAGQGRSDGDFAWPVIRLADVYLMYAEAANEVNNGPTADAIALVNKVRHRGNLPPLGPTRTDNYQDFFNAIEQERIVELIGEGQRGFDLRRWRAIERVWGPPGSAGVWRIDTWNANQQRYFQNTSDLEYHQDYIFRIPPGERDKNPNLTQNIPWR